MGDSGPTYMDHNMYLPSVLDTPTLFPHFSIAFDI